MSAIPNFFIVGAPKCGTTAMFDHLAQHPDVFMPARKETQFFARDLDERRHGDDRTFIRDLDQYLDLFADWRGERGIGEGSVWHLYSKVAAGEIKKFSPEARIIIMLRNPVDAMHSLHAQRLVSGAEDIASFEEAVRAEEDRARGKRIPRYAFIAKGLQYRQVVRWSSQVERYFDTFGRDRVLTLLFEEFVADPACAYRKVCAFLDVDPDFVPTFNRVNPSSVVRSRLVRDVLRFHPALPGATRYPPGFVRKHWRRLKRALVLMNEKPQARPPLDAALRAELARELAPDVARLGHVVGRNLIAFWNFPNPDDIG